MIKEEILAMEAGEELDTLIVKEIIGGVGDRYPTVLSPRPPEYSTDISAAWQVVEKVKEIGQGCQVEILTGIFNKYRVKVREFSVDAIITDVVGNTFPEAICKAALLTKLGVD